MSAEQLKTLAAVTIFNRVNQTTAVEPFDHLIAALDRARDASRTEHVTAHVLCRTRTGSRLDGACSRLWTYQAGQVTATLDVYDQGGVDDGDQGSIHDAPTGEPDTGHLDTERRLALMLKASTPAAMLTSLAKAIRASVEGEPPEHLRTVAWRKLAGWIEAALAHYHRLLGTDLGAQE